MWNEQRYMCKVLCDSYGNVLEYLADTGQEEKLEKALLLLAENCYVEIDDEFGTCINAKWQFLDRDGVAVQLETFLSYIRGYADYEIAYEAEISAGVADAAEELARKLWEKQKDVSELEVVEKKKDGCYWVALQL